MHTESAQFPVDTVERPDVAQRRVLALPDTERLNQIRHWMDRRRAMPKRRVELPCHFEFTREDMAALAWGWVPQVMEDHWFGLLQEGAIDFHRSWTGYHIYRLLLEQDGDLIVVRRMLVNNDSRQYTGLNQWKPEEDKVAPLIDWMLREGRELMAQAADTGGL